MSLGPPYFFLGEMCFQVFFSFLIGWLVFLEWSHISSLYILETRPLSEVSLANMFSPTVGSLFILSLFSLAMQKKLFSHLCFILSFLSLALGNISVYSFFFVPCLLCLFVYCFLISQLFICLSFPLCPLL